MFFIFYEKHDSSTKIKDFMKLTKKEREKLTTTECEKLTTIEREKLTTRLVVQYFSLFSTETVI